MTLTVSVIMTKLNIMKKGSDLYLKSLIVIGLSITECNGSL